MDFVVAPVVFGAEVDVVEIDGGDAPEVAGNHVVAEYGLVVGGASVDGDAAATVHGVFFMEVVEELVAFDHG